MITAVPLTPSPHRGEGAKLDKALFYLPPHTNLLPQGGEGTTPILGDAISSLQWFRLTKSSQNQSLINITLMLTGQQ